jgi:hypothetical protein
MPGRIGRGRKFRNGLPPLQQVAAHQKAAATRKRDAKGVLENNRVTGSTALARYHEAAARLIHLKMNNEKIDSSSPTPMPKKAAKKENYKKNRQRDVEKSLTAKRNCSCRRKEYSLSFSKTIFQRLCVGHLVRLRLLTRGVDIRLDNAARPFKPCEQFHLLPKRPAQF